MRLLSQYKHYAVLLQPSALMKDQEEEEDSYPQSCRLNGKLKTHLF